MIEKLEAIEAKLDEIIKLLGIEVKNQRFFVFVMR